LSHSSILLSLCLFSVLLGFHGHYQNSSCRRQELESSHLSVPWRITTISNSVLTLSHSSILLSLCLFSVLLGFHGHYQNSSCRRQELESSHLYQLEVALLRRPGLPSSCSSMAGLVSSRWGSRCGRLLQRSLGLRLLEWAMLLGRNLRIRHHLKLEIACLLTILDY